MEKKINNILFFNSNDGERLEFHVLFTYYSEKFKKDYAVFYNVNDENHLIAYAFDESNTLYGLEAQEEYAELEVALKQYDEEAANAKQ